MSPRVSSLLSGALIGLWASRYRRAIAARSADFYEAFLGSETKSSWPLQSLVAIVALGFIVFAIKPELLDNLESFKAGEVEAKFANISASTRESRVTTNDLSKQVTIKQWVDFKKDFREGSARDYALEFDFSEIKEFRKRIRDILFEDYVEPLARLIDCLSEDDRMDRLRKGEDFERLAITFRNAILKEAKDGSGAAFKMYDWIHLLEQADAQIRRAVEIVNSEIPSDVVNDKCRQIAKINTDFIDITIRSQHNAMLLDAEVRGAVEKLKELPNEKGYRLSFLDPYLISAVSDLIVLTLGHGEKAIFLEQIKSFYPRELEYIEPGIINLYYYLSDAKLKSDAPWPLDEEVEELDFAMAGADHMVDMSRKKSDEARRGATKAGKRTLSTPYDAIIKVYFSNKFVFLTRYLEIFVQHWLSGEVLEEYSKFKWTQFYKQAEAVLNLRELGPSLDLEGPGASVEQDLQEWRNINIGPEVRFDARIALALSAIMLTERKNKSTSQACTIGRFQLLKAKELLPDVTSNEADKSRLRGYLSQIEARVKAVCPDTR